MEIEFAEWRPDVADLNTGVASVARNVLAADGSYIPFPKLAVLSQALPARPLSGFVARQTTGLYRIFAGTATGLYLLDTTDFSWTNVSRTTGGAYNASVDEPWRFEQFGQYVVAVNVNDAPQVFDVDSGTAFAALAGSPPNSRFVAVWGDFLVLAGQANDPAKLHWSGINDIEEWTVGTNLSDVQVFPEGGAIQGLTSSNNPMIIQEAAIRRGAFQPGSPLVFSFDKIADKFGARSPFTVTSRNDAVFFFAEDGFYQVAYTGEIVSIGSEKVNRYAQTLVDNSYIDKMFAQVDPVHPRVYFGLKSVNVFSDYADVILVYDWRLGRWTEARANTYAMVAAATPGYSLEALSVLYPVLEQVPASLDSRIWAGGAPVTAAFDTSYRLAFFTGSAAAATLETSEYGATDGSMQEVQAVMPIVDTDEVSISVGGRKRRGEAVAFKDGRRPSSNTGLVRVRNRTRYHKFRMEIDDEATWNHAKGVDVQFIGAGQR